MRASRGQQGGQRFGGNRCGGKADKPKLTMGVAEIIRGIVAAANWVFKRQGNGVQLAVTGAHVPNEVVDVGDRF